MARQNNRYFAVDTFKHIFLNENARSWIKISLMFVSKRPINNIPALVQLMAWRQPGDKPLSEPMVVRLPTHICVTRPQWVKYQSRTHTRQDHDHDHGMQIHTLVPKGAQCSAIGRGVLDFYLNVSFNLVERITLFKRPTRTHESRNCVIF